MSWGKRSFGYNDVGVSLEKFEFMILEVDIYGFVYYFGYYFIMCLVVLWGSGDELCW